MEKEYELLDKQVNLVLRKYSESFSEKIYNTENNDIDILMEIFDISPELKRENKQYWGRELGMVCQHLIVNLFEILTPLYKPAIRIGNDEPFDLIYDNYAIDAKYRIGSGDAGTLKKFKSYSKKLKDMGYIPLLLILRTDNLPQALTACKNGGWTILKGDECFEFIKKELKIDFGTYLNKFIHEYKIKRNETT